MAKNGKGGEDKLRGGYYTLSSVAEWLCRWAIRTPSERVLEPSCGDGVFLEAALRRLCSLGANVSGVSRQLAGVEINNGEAAKARMRLSQFLVGDASRVVHSDDFFAWVQDTGSARFDSVVGNPPFIRYQSFPEPCRSRAMALMSMEGLRPNKLTNAWVPFVVGAVRLLRPGGRLAMVLPAELLQVTYAGQLRSFLADHFESIDIVSCNQLFFQGAEQEVVLLLADHRVAVPSLGNPCRIDMRSSNTVADVLQTNIDPGKRNGRRKVVQHDSEKWLKYFLTADEITFMRGLKAAKEVACLSRHACVDVGVVTGNNDFFVLTLDEAHSLGVSEYTIPLIGRSRQLEGAVLRLPEWGDLAAHGHRVLLFHVNGQNNGNLSATAKAYIASGEEKLVHKGYKCSVRSPWYCVPAVWVPHCLLFRQIYDFPRGVLNSAKVVTTDTIHRMICKSPVTKVLTNLYTHLTAASAEIEGRSYGGGVLELEPTEAERLLIPQELQEGLPPGEIDRMVRQGRLADVLRENDRFVLIEGLGLSQNDCSRLRRVWERMRGRRHSRRNVQAHVGR